MKTIFSGHIDQPKQVNLRPDGKQFTKQIAVVDEYLRKISEQVDITKICSHELQNVLKMGNFHQILNWCKNVCKLFFLFFFMNTSDNPSAVAGIILHRLELIRMPKSYSIFTDEQHMRKALNNLFSWMKFTFFIRNLDQWILKVVSDLQVSDIHRCYSEIFICM